MGHKQDLNCRAGAGVLANRGAAGASFGARLLLS
jgi:hypothetical protein